MKTLSVDFLRAIAACQQGIAFVKTFAELQDHNYHDLEINGDLDGLVRWAELSLTDPVYNDKGQLTEIGKVTSRRYIGYAPDGTIESVRCGNTNIDQLVYPTIRVVVGGIPILLDLGIDQHLPLPQAEVTDVRRDKDGFIETVSFTDRGIKGTLSIYREGDIAKVYMVDETNEFKLWSRTIDTKLKMTTHLNDFQNDQYSVVSVLGKYLVMSTHDVKHNVEIYTSLDVDTGRRLPDQVSIVFNGTKTGVRSDRTELPDGSWILTECAEAQSGRFELYNEQNFLMYSNNRSISSSYDRDEKGNLTFLAVDNNDACNPSRLTVKIK